jgi:hypothetical protein
MAEMMIKARFSHFSSEGRYAANMPDTVPKNLPGCPNAGLLPRGESLR